MAAGYNMDDLTVLAAQNDPYRVDTPAGHRDGRWLAERLAVQAERLAGRRIHIRGLHYILIDQTKPNGKPYTNTEDDWLWLSGKAAKAARWLGYIPFDKIVDNRNAPPVVRVFTPPDPQPFISSGVDIQIPEAEDLEPRAQVFGFWGAQPCKLVLLGEKASLEDVLAPIAESRQADLYLPTGEASDTMIHDMARIGAEDGRHMVVFYLSDCDPAGWQMAISVARKLQAFRDLSYPDLSFEVRPVALTPAQVREYGLPSTPLKATERRADAWTKAMGVLQTEIDALATLRPSVLAKLVRQAIKPFFDATLAGRVIKARDEWLVEAQAQFDAQIDPDHLERIRADAAAKLEELTDEVAAIEEALRVDTTGIEFPEPVIPQPEALPPANGKPLIHSDWPHAEAALALKAHKRYQNGSAD
jgi:hypothetical protein